MTGSDESTAPTPPAALSDEELIEHRLNRTIPVTPERAARHRGATAARRFIDRFVDLDAGLGDLERLADRLEELAALVDTLPRGTRWSIAEAGPMGGERRDEHLVGFVDHSPVIGLANPTAPPLSLRLEGRQVIGKAVFGMAYEGPPGHVHGGWIASTFDEVLGMTQSISGKSGMTANLSIDYKRPTPLHTEITYVGELDRVDGRKIHTIGRAYDPAGNLLDEARGLFISIDFEKMREAMEHGRGA